MLVDIPDGNILMEIKFLADVLTGCVSYLQEQPVPEII
jgi:hypothetical protein